MTIRVGLCYDERVSSHRGPFGHPERPERLQACVEALERQPFWDSLERVTAREARKDELLRLHTEAHLDHVETLAAARDFVNPDTYICSQTPLAARLAAGASLTIAEQILDKQLDAGFALVRPPGHHAEPDCAKGFCFFNNISLVALLCRERGLRVAIFDFDVHHGDGTQLAHLRDPDVLFISVHRYGLGFYPGSGAASEQGVGAGQGATLNLPLFAGADGAAVLEAFCDRALPKLIDFAPDILLVSAGFDGHQDDPLSDAMLDDASYQQLCKRLADAAATICQGRWMGILEGGYHLQALSRGVCALVGAMAGVTAKQASDE